jgi:hypothetical protein
MIISPPLIEDKEEWMKVTPIDCSISMVVIIDMP